MTDHPNAHPATQKYRRGLAALIIGLLVLWGPAYRALLDKLWAINGGMSLVGEWAQLQNIMELVAAPTFVGVGIGLTVLVAQRSQKEHKPLLVAAILIGLLTALPVVALPFILQDQLTHLIGFAQSQNRLIPLAAMAGYLSIVLGVLNGYWLGQRNVAKALLATVISALPGIGYVIHAVSDNKEPDPAILLLVIVLTHLLTVLIFFGLTWRWYKADSSFITDVKTALRPLAPFVLSGLATGILTPLSGIVIRTSIAEQMDWAAAGAATALWRASDWILSAVNSVLYYHFLPRLSINVAEGMLPQGLRLGTLAVIIPGCLLLIMLYAFQKPILSLLYTSDLLIPQTVSALFWGGDALRMFASLLLFGLYAMHANRAIAFGEFFSQPMLALVLALGVTHSLLGVGLAQMATYVIYTGLNLWLVLNIWTWNKRKSISGDYLQKMNTGQN